MPKIEKLPSGTYRIRVYDKNAKKQISFTAQTKQELKQIVAEWEINAHKSKISNTEKTVKELVEDYIKSKENVLSPSTVRGYYIVLNNALGDIADCKACNLTEKDLQIWVNNNAQRYSPKSVRNQFGLVTATLKQNHIHLNFDEVRLPAKEKYTPRIPTEQEIAQILTIVEGTRIELAVTLAVTLGLRQSEISALKWSDYDGKYLYIHASRVPNKDNEYIVKQTTKSQASTRTLEVCGLCKERLDKAERVVEYISNVHPAVVLQTFKRLCKQNGLPEFTMHAQRHGYASLMLLEGVPDKYAMARLGQSSTNMIKNVYQHLYDEKQEEISKAMSDKFSQILDTKLDKEK